MKQRQHIGIFFGAAKKPCLVLLILLAAGLARGEKLKPLPPPQGLRTEPRQLCVNLQWEPVPGAAGYELQRARSVVGPFEWLHNNFPLLTRCNDFIGEGNERFFYRARSVWADDKGRVLRSEWSPLVAGHSEPLDPDRLLTEVQQAGFDYFYQYGHPRSGLARASLRQNPDCCAIGATGMGFFNLGVGIERGFITRREGAERALEELKFLSMDAQRFHGAFPHYLNGQTGKVIPFSKYDDGADIVETAFLMEGVLFAREFFSQTDPGEAEIRRLADNLWRGVEWDWFVGETNASPVMIWHWSPDYGWKINLHITGFNECQIVYVLALASPTHAIDPEFYWRGWESANYSSNRIEYGIPLELGRRPMVGPPLFMTHYSYLGLDPHQLEFHGRTYFDHFRDFCRVQIRYAEARGDVYKGYGPLWGITASAGPDGYRAFAPGLRDNGTLAPTAALSSMPYVPEESRACLLKMYQDYGYKLWGPFGFYDSFNLTRDWVARTYLCIDEGPIAPMIENYRTGLCWKTFMKAKEIQAVVKLLNEGEKQRKQESARGGWGNL